MKMIYNKYRKFFLVVAVLSATMMTSCTDFLTIIPPEKIVHEHFWQTKDDVNGILATSYLKLISTDAVAKSIVWGELRADDLNYTPSTSNSHELRYIVEANILPENNYASWSVFYEAIANANLVLEYAPLVVERDPDFTSGDLDVVMGEMYAMRALCHFYLVRTFRDIPMAMVVAANDADLPKYSQVHPLEALRMIMEDLDRAEKLVMPSGNFSQDRYNCGRITRNAVLAIKADVSLWQAAFATYYEGESEYVTGGDVDMYYNNCIANCEAVIRNMENQYLKDNKEEVMPNDNPYLLIENSGDAVTLKNGNANGEGQWNSDAYRQIFGNGNSAESIFEHNIDDDLVDDGTYGKAIYNLYGTEGQPGGGQLCVPKNFANKYAKDDLRQYSYTDISKLDNKNTYYTVAKYTAAAPNAKDYRKESTRDANWIVYRKTDVMLMMAEALALLPGAGNDEFTRALDIVKAVNFRSRIGSNDYKGARTDITRKDITFFDQTNRVDASRYMTKETCLQLVLDERAREFAFEGKRWYDLVRKALREKSTNGITFVADKLDNNAAVVKSKMTTIDGLFFPIHTDEIRFNKLLKQNPAYATDDSTSEMIK